MSISLAALLIILGIVLMIVVNFWLGLILLLIGLALAVAPNLQRR
jgi:hypothetical protein